MNYEQNCSKCGRPLKRIPIKNLDSTLIMEFYCDQCDESITFYQDLDKINLVDRNFSIKIKELS